MSKKKQVLSLTYDFSFTLFSVICHHKDYRLCYEINTSLGIDLRKEENLDVLTGKAKQSAEFSLYQYFLTDEKIISVISNRNGASTLIPEMGNTDYFIILRGGFLKEESEAIKTQLKKLKIILGLYETVPESLKSKENLLL